MFVLEVGVHISDSVFDKIPSPNDGAANTSNSVALIRKWSLVCCYSDFLSMSFELPNNFLCLFAGRKSSVWVRVWYECPWLPGDSCLTELDEFLGSIVRLCGQRAGLLPAPHGHPVQLCHLLLIAVSVCVRCDLTCTGITTVFQISAKVKLFVIILAKK